jgi:hypothetical protein
MEVRLHLETRYTGPCEEACTCRGIEIRLHLDSVILFRLGSPSRDVYSDLDVPLTNCWTLPSNWPRPVHESYPFACSTL